MKITDVKISEITESRRITELNQFKKDSVYLSEDQLFSFAGFDEDGNATFKNEGQFCYKTGKKLGTGKNLSFAVSNYDLNSCKWLEVISTKTSETAEACIFHNISIFDFVRLPEQEKEELINKMKEGVKKMKSINEIHAEAANYHGLSELSFQELTGIQKSELVFQMNQGIDDFKRLNENEVIIYEGPLTIAGQIEARKRSLSSVVFQLENPDKAEHEPGFLKTLEEVHRKELRLLKLL